VERQGGIAALLRRRDHHVVYALSIFKDIL
jgi:hypothetical protein